MAPRTDVDSEPFWAALREHRIVLQCCAADGRLRFPPMLSCPHCGTPGGDVVEVSGDARVYSWVTVHWPLTPAMADEVPYTIATVELAEGARMVGRLEGEAGDGVAVTATFVDHDDWTELRWAVSAASGGDRASASEPGADGSGAQPQGGIA